MFIDRTAELKALLGLQPHPEGGHFREVFRSTAAVEPLDGRPRRSALTVIDFLLGAGERSAWHQVRSDEAWHLLEGGPLWLWCVPPTLDRLDRLRLGLASAQGVMPRHVVPAGWWQAAEPEGAYALVGATVGPGFDFDDFRFGREDAAFVEALQRLAPGTHRLL
jgi:predicted cupin superfamily sugar epimerase